MLNDLFLEAWTALKIAASGKEHPFNFCSLATTGRNETIKQRTVVLRGLTEEKSLLFYTDLRSTKIKHLKRNPNVSVLFYDPKIQLQLIFKGTIVIHTNDEDWEEHKDRIGGSAINNYNTLLPPGKSIKNPFTVERTEKLHFGLLEFKPQQMEFLKLKRDSNHLRAKFRLEEGLWKKSFLVP